MNDTIPYNPLPDRPVAVLLKELKSKIIGQLVGQMKAREIWLPDDKYNRIVQSRREQGDRIRQELLSPALGPADDALLNAESIYGFRNYRLASRIPRILSFGFDIGAGFHELLAPGGPGRVPVARLGALYNLGISLFDRAGDGYRSDGQAGAGVFATVFDERALSALMDDPARHISLAAAADKVSDAELRILLKVICLFFSQLHGSAATSYPAMPYSAASHPAATEWEKLRGLLLNAYRSQLQTIAPDLTFPAPPPGMAGSKSSLPFFILSQLTRLRENITPENAQRFDQIEEAIAAVFWEIDDLVDLAADIKSGDVNSIVTSPRGNAAGDVARHFLQGPEIAIAVDRFCVHVTGLLDLLMTLPVRRDGGIAFHELILAYVRGWVPKQV
jgi:hypothetical protein